MAKGYKTGGRDKGTPNKMNKEIRELINAVLKNGMQELPENISRLTNKEKIEIYIKLLPYVLAKADTDTQETQQPIIVNIAPAID